VLPGLANGLGCLHISAQTAAVQTSDVGLSFIDVVTYDPVPGFHVAPRASSDQRAQWGFSRRGGAQLYPRRWPGCLPNFQSGPER
jgi:hypothetical protein